MFFSFFTLLKCTSQSGANKRVAFKKKRSEARAQTAGGGGSRSRCAESGAWRCSDARSRFCISCSNRTWQDLVSPTPTPMSPLLAHAAVLSRSRTLKHTRTHTCTLSLHSGFLQWEQLVRGKVCGPLKKEKERKHGTAEAKKIYFQLQQIKKGKKRKTGKVIVHAGGAGCYLKCLKRNK